MTDERTESGFLPSVAAEMLGTLLVTLVTVGTIVLAGPSVGPLGVALAAGFALAAAYTASAGVSGGHLNPVVTVGLALAGRFPWRDAPTHIVAQLVGATIGAGLVLAIVADGPAAALAAAQRDGFGTGGYGPELSPGGYGLVAVALVEAAAAAVLVALYVVRRPAGSSSPEGRAATGLTIGLAVSALTLVTTSVSGAPFNPARALAAAVFAGPDRLAQVWAFVVFPLVGALVVGLVTRIATRSASTPSAAAGS